jgi:hypothetical protein
MGADDLYQALAGATPPLIVDVRRQAAFGSLPQRLPDAVPVVLDVEPLRIPDVPRDRPLVAYCLCSGEASSSRVAQWLLRDYRDVACWSAGCGRLDVATRRSHPTAKRGACPGRSSRIARSRTPRRSRSRPTPRSCRVWPATAS